MIIKPNKNSKKRFRIQSKSFFLTYPQVPLWVTESLVLDSIKQVFPKREHEMMKYLITKEYHKDGNPHIHVFLEFPFINYINSREQLNLSLIEPETGKEKVLEGKYESSKKKYSVIKYVLKDQCGDPFTNMRLLIYRNTVHDNVEEYLLHRARYEGVEKTVMELMDYFPELMKQIVRLTSAFKRIREAERNKERQELMLSRIKPMDSYVNIPVEVLEWNKQRPPTHTLALYGPPNTGKTELGLSLLKDREVEVIHFTRDENQLRGKEITSKDGIVFDDFDILKKSRESAIHMIDNKHEGSIRVLHDQLNIPSDTPKILTGNHIP